MFSHTKLLLHLLTHEHVHMLIHTWIQSHSHIHECTHINTHFSTITPILTCSFPQIPIFTHSLNEHIHTLTYSNTEKPYTFIDTKENVHINAHPYIRSHAQSCSDTPEHKQTLTWSNKHIDIFTHMNLLTDQFACTDTPHIHLQLH